MDPTNLVEALRKSTIAAIGGEPVVAVAYSGGIDSSIVAALAREKSCVKCYTCATDGSYDSRRAGEFASLDRLSHRLITLSEHDLERAVHTASSVLGTSDPTKIAYTIPTLKVLETCEESCLLTGHGADELFGGYAKYSSSENPRPIMAKDIDKMEHEIRLLTAYASVLQKRVGFPFATAEMMAFSEMLPLEVKVTPTGRKIILREAAKQMGLASHDRPKKAAQYSSGVLELMKRLARNEHLALDDWTFKVSNGI